MRESGRRRAISISILAIALLAVSALVLAFVMREHETATFGLVAFAFVAVAYVIWRGERARVRVELARSEARFATLFEHAEDVILLLAPDARILEANRQAEQVYGYAHADLVRMYGQDLRPADTRDQVAANFAKIVREGRARFETVHQRKDGTQFPVEINARYVECEGLQTIVAILRDMTAHERQEEALRESEARFRLLAEQAQDVIYRYRLRPTQGVEYVSPAATAMSGHAPQDFYDDPALMLKIVHPEDREVVARVLTGALTRGEVLTDPIAVRWVRPDGTTVWTELRSVGIRDETGAVVAIQGIVRDVTERKRTEDALLETERQLLQAQKLEAVGRLAAGVAHDFNNLLTIITGYAKILGDAMPPTDPRRREVSEIIEAASRAAGLTRQLLAFGRRLVLQPRVLNLNTVVAEVAKMLNRLIGEDIEVFIRAEPGLGNVEVDEGQIQQVIMNLAVNARDAMPAGGTLTLETANVTLSEEYAWEHSPVRPGEYVMLAVSDTGIGMDAETRAHIFEPFFTTKAEGKGTGLGLSTVYGIVKQSGGYIWVYSEPGQGATFKIYLPRVARAVEAEAEAPARATDLRGGETVLVVEDQPMLRRLVERILEQHGYRAILAGNGREALEIVGAPDQTIDLMVTDVVMPGMSGLELASRVGELRPGVRIVYTSGYTQEAPGGGRPLPDGVKFLQKPFTATALLEKVREALG